MTEINPASIRAICFDLDNTLWPTEEVIHASESALFDWIREKHPELATLYTVQTLRAARLDYARSRPELLHDLTKLRSRHLQALFEQHGYPIESVRDGMDIFLAYRNRVRPYPDVVPALSRLQPHYQLTSLTNGNASAEQSAIGHFFTLSLTSAAAGIAKPDKGIFMQLSRMTRLKPREILHVGDDPHNDIVGASAAGLRTAWINREGRAWEIEPDADFQISDLHELCDVLMSRS
jgi:HAD superfamily hydrolase (TIGR01549 family)